MSAIRHFPNAGNRSSLLPFLYQTRTIRRHSSLRPHSSTRAQESNGHFNKATRRRLHISPARLSYVPFEGTDEPPARAAQKWPSAAKDNSSLSAGEREAFAKLFQKLVTKETAPTGTGGGKDASEPKDGQGKGDARKQRLSADDLARLPPSVRQLADSAFARIEEARGEQRRVQEAEEGAKGEDVATGNAEDTASADRLDAELAQHIQQVVGMMDAQTTDVRVWQTLERTVFSPLEELDLDNTLAPGKRSKKKQAARKPARKEQRSPPSSKAVPTTRPELLLASLPHVLAAASSRMRALHPSSPLPASLLPHLSRLSSAARTLAPSPRLYADVIAAGWARYRSPRGAVEVLREMEAEGVELDREVLGVLADVVKEGREMLAGRYGGDGDEGTGELVRRVVTGVEGWAERLEEVRRVWVPKVRQRIVDAAVRIAREREAEEEEEADEMEREEGEGRDDGGSRVLVGFETGGSEVDEVRSLPDRPAGNGGDDSSGRADDKSSEGEMVRK